MTLVELMVVVAVGSIMVAAAAAWSIPWFAKESMRSSIHEVQVYMQLARIEAVSRNQACRFFVDTSTSTIRVYDTLGTTGTTSDDQMLHEKVLSDAVSFANPQSGAAVTLNSLGSNQWDTSFDGDGTVAGGAGDVMLYGGDRYGKISVFDAGGMRVQRWDGSQWVAGS